MKSSVFNNKNYTEVTKEFDYLLSRKQHESDDEYKYRKQRGFVSAEIKHRLTKESKIYSEELKKEGY